MTDLTSASFAECSAPVSSRSTSSASSAPGTRAGGTKPCLTASASVVASHISRLDDPLETSSSRNSCRGCTGKCACGVSAGSDWSGVLPGGTTGVVAVAVAATAAASGLDKSGASGAWTGEAGRGGRGEGTVAAPAGTGATDGAVAGGEYCDEAESGVPCVMGAVGGNGSGTGTGSDTGPDRSASGA